MAHSTYGTAARSYTPSSMINAGLYDLSPSTLRQDGTRPRPLFDATTAEGRAARDAYLIDTERSETAKASARARYAAGQGIGEGMFGEGI